VTCSRLSCATIGLILLLGLVYPGAGLAEPTGKQGKIQGESHVNIRSGADLSFPAVAVVRQGDLITVEGEEASWYRVALSDGTRGYVHKTFVRLVAPEEKKELPPPSLTREMQRSRSEPLPAAPFIEEREWQALKWVATVLCVFGLGWILGGNYYLRRDRVKRRKLQL